MDEGMLKNGAIIGKQIAGGDIPTKKRILTDIFHGISTGPTTLHQAFLCDIHKSLIPCFLVPNENCRILSVQIITKLIKASNEPQIIMKHLVSALMDSLNAYDLEGIANLPDQMKPNPSQKPRQIINPKEKSEEVRKLIAELVQCVVVTKEMHQYFNDLVDILRALCFDPSGDVILRGCTAMMLFCDTYGMLLNNFAKILGNALYTALTHKFSEVRIEGLRALNSVFKAGEYKNAFIAEELIGLKDPNLVPIKDFYEATTKINYLAILCKDPNAKVRKLFYGYIGVWLTVLSDKKDNEAKYLPYLLSGLHDEVSEFQTYCFELLEDIGKKYEVENEESLRDVKQLGHKEIWTRNGEMEKLPLPFPFKNRPRLGSRIIIKSHLRKYLIALCREIEDMNEGNSIIRK